MSETSSEVSRFAQIRNAVRSALELGLKGPAKRREAVIDINSSQTKKITTLLPEDVNKIHSVAKENIDDESQETKENAIRKYVEIIEPTKETALIIDAVHASEPNSTQIYDVLHRNNPEDPDINMQSIELSLSKIKQGEELNNFDQVVQLVHDKRDENTGPIARKIAILTGAGAIIAKKPRTISDLNRNWWSREKFGDQGFYPKEYARSGRAAFYWAIKEVLTKSKLLVNSKLSSPVLRLAIHGMVDNGKYDFAIAGADKIADPIILEKFTTALNKKIRNYNLRIDGEYPKVVIAKRSDPDTSKYSGENVGHSTFRRELTKHPSQHPAFGPEFNTMQIEISAKIRNNPQNRELASIILAEAAEEVIKEFNEPSPSSTHQNTSSQS